MNIQETDTRAHRHFVASIEQSIGLANREVINPLIHPFTEERIFAFAVEVAKLRGAYLKAALDIGQRSNARPEASELKTLRQAFEEARDAFSALMTAIERGYVDLPEAAKG